MSKNKKDKGFFIKCYLGKTGSGKTLSMVEEEIIPALLKGRLVVSNFFINWSGDNLVYFSDLDDLYNVKHALICVDEVGDVIRPDKFKEFTKEELNIVRFHRKRFNDLVFSSQDISQVAKFMRVNIHYWRLCENNDSYLKSLFFKIFLRTDVVSMSVLDLDFSDLKKLSLGLGAFDLGSKVLSNDDMDDFSETFAEDTDISSNNDYQVKVSPDSKNYLVKKITHHELSENKKYLYGVFCSECNDFIKMLDERDKEKIDLSDFSCEIHGSEFLSIKEVPMYSTTQEIQTSNKEYVIKKYKKVMRETLIQE